MNPIDLPDIKSNIAAIAIQSGVPFESLKPRVLLHLPRFRYDELMDQSIVRNEIHRITNQLISAYKADDLRLKYDLTDSSLKDYEVAPSAQNDIDLIIGQLHYLQTIRKDSIYLSLLYKPLNLAVGIISFSPFDLAHLDINPIIPINAMILSRLYTVPMLPFNINSFFIAKAKRWLISINPHVKVLFTYLNRNAGFNGAIYRSTNWKLIMKRSSTSYAYLNKDFATWRTISNTFGTTNRTKLRKFGNVSFSQIELDPLELYMLRLIKDLPALKFETPTIH